MLWSYLIPGLVPRPHPKNREKGPGHTSHISCSYMETYAKCDQGSFPDFWVGPGDETTPDPNPLTLWRRVVSLPAPKLHTQAVWSLGTRVTSTVKPISSTPDCGLAVLRKLSFHLISCRNIISWTVVQVWVCMHKTAVNLTLCILMVLLSDHYPQLTDQVLTCMSNFQQFLQPSFYLSKTHWFNLVYIYKPFLRK